MAALSRTAQFSRLHKLLARHYKPVAPDAKRSVLEHLLFACCLENAHYDAAEEAFAAMVDSFFDWNEIRVSTVRELSEVMAGLPDPRAAARRFKRVLQSIFETTYAFDLEELRKLSLGAAQERLTKIEGVSRFAMAYVTQAALGGHAIPLDAGTLGVLALVHLATEAEVASGTIGGLERAIPKNAGLEFASLLHQLGADYVATPFSRKLHEILLEIEPSVADRLPCRRLRKPEPAGATAETAAEAPAEKPPASKRKAGAAEAVAQDKPRRKAGEKAPRAASTDPRSASLVKKGTGQPSAGKERKVSQAGKGGKAPRAATADTSASPSPAGASASQSVTHSATPAPSSTALPAIESDGVPPSAIAAGQPRPPGAGGGETPAPPIPAEIPPAPPAPKVKPSVGPQRGKRKPSAQPQADPDAAEISPAQRLSKRKPR